MYEFIAPEFKSIFQQHQLSFDVLWNMQIGAVDEPNKRKDGWSQVSYFELPEGNFYLHRQEAYFTRTLNKPFGEPTFRREFRATQKFANLGIPAMKSAYFAQRGKKAILITYALDGYQELQQYLDRWLELSQEIQEGIILACAKLAKILHQAGQIHNCFYPKHIFLKELAEGGFDAKLIDLEKTRAIIFPKRDRIRDLETLKRRSGGVISEALWRLFLKTYLGSDEQVESWLFSVNKRQANKEQRK